MNEQNRFDEYIEAHPRESLYILAIVTCFFWQSLMCVFGIGCYLVLTRVFRLRWLSIFLSGMVVAGIAVFLHSYINKSNLDLLEFIRNGLMINGVFWKYLLKGCVRCAVLSMYHNGLVYVLGLPVLFSGVLSMISLIQDNPHQKAMQALHNGRLLNDRPELNEKEIELALNKLSDDEGDGTVLGISKFTGKNVVIPDHYVNQIVLVLGTTGGGKTVTLRRFYQRAIKRGYPLVMVDGKPTDENVEWLMRLADKYDRPFYGFNCGNFCHYDPLANGGYTELKDKIISLKDQWENDYYRSIAEDYLQTTFEVLLKSGKPFDLKRVVECMNYLELEGLAREMGDEALLKRVGSLESYERKDITGLQAHINLLIHSELGRYFSVGENKAFTLPQVLAEDAVVYFALPALRFPSFSKVLGKLVINDLKAVIDRNNGKQKPVFMVFDEFSVFAGEQVLNLVNMGRGKGVHAVFGTQGLADLEKVDAMFKNQILNCANTLICHRLNDNDSAESVAHWIGTLDTFSVTAQLNIKQAEVGLGTVKRIKGFVVHPDQIKQELGVGEAYFVSKVGSYGWEKVRVKM